ncbi:phosphoserine phosphatase [Naumannella halotolerans]|uniref:phosphoserine phosphatase n=1 Tax=Naumannella halotolerans TaxID=993414 RepID=A0A4R7JCV7_9ACTN|nr:phosphoserine phosphatase [Naumannella halotolerans]
MSAAPLELPLGAHPVISRDVAGPELYGWWRRDPGGLVPVEANDRTEGVDRCDIVGALAEAPPGLLVMDVDSTLITAEQIELLADHAGVRDRVAEVTERAMRGELDFAASLAERVATLAGLPVEVIEEVRQSISLSPGAIELIAAVRRHGGQVGLISGGFIEITGPIAEALDITLIRANRLEVVDGILTGRTTGPVIDRAAKQHWLEAYAQTLGVPRELTVAIGDGANDLDMLAAAGLGIAYCAKPVVAAAADASIGFPRLDAAAVFLGLI